MRARGKIVRWNDDKGFGFIAPEMDGKHIFVHITTFSGGPRRPDIGDLVTYEFVCDAQGRGRAENVTTKRGTFPSGFMSKSLVGAIIFLFVVASVTVSGRLPLMVFWLYLAMSLLTFGMYALDKSAARSGAQRTPENTLHLLALLGGWSGALYAQQYLRHKSRKTAFRVVFWVTLALNLAVFCYLLSPYGTWLAHTINRIGS